MIRIPAPSIAAGLAGFVLGVIVTLALSGTLGPSKNTASPPATLPPPTAVPVAQMYQRVSHIVDRTLGPGGYPLPKKSRVVSVRLTAAASEPLPPPPFHHITTSYQSVYIVFRLNDHPLGPTWRLKAAKADVFGVLKALYTSQLPIYNVKMVGIFPVRSGTKLQDRRVMVAMMVHHTAETIPWKRWGRDKEGRLWLALTYRYVSPQFA